MWREIGIAFRAIGSLGDDCRCVLLVGAGKSFCAGIDIADENFGLMSVNDEEIEADVARRYMSFRPKILEMQACLTSIEECPVPVVAAIHGACIGAGIDMTCCADVRFCSPSSKFSVREAKLGLAADVGTLQRLPKICGHSSRIRELCFTGENFGAGEAYRLGFVSRISDSDEGLIEMALDTCQRIGNNSPVAVQGTKLSLNYSRDHTVKDGLEHIASHNAAALMTKDLMDSFMATSSGKDKADFEPLLMHSKL
jgi:enoyl-CoA hydratase/carnithine racemase